ncbi:hypothetical protein [Massilia sp. Leaf139]|uniref:hypothetical protein n=1 Tax=Massilia sp. Leaf139 TaxID=1736272 RepID=UPI0006FA50FF|nr:hypothetical protein [Massilia sp. Leaf139]KQQ89226.1 hypothetical protein ASF77_11220 [Massilia sp. Leaf139]
MAWIVQLFIPRRRKNRQELAARAAEVIAKVLFDIGIDRFLNGSLLIDRALRVRFVSCPTAVGDVHAAVRADTLAQAHALRDAHEGGLATLPRQHQILCLADELMAALLAQSPVLRALPAQRNAIDEVQAAPARSQA